MLVASRGVLYRSAGRLRRVCRQRALVVAEPGRRVKYPQRWRGVLARLPGFVDLVFGIPVLAGQAGGAGPRPVQRSGAGLVHRRRGQLRGQLERTAGATLGLALSAAGVVTTVVASAAGAPYHAGFWRREPSV
jgi:hypothetical protein